jgi:hypothetical protein
MRANRQPLRDCELLAKKSFPQNKKSFGQKALPGLVSSDGLCEYLSSACAHLFIYCQIKPCLED